MPPSRRFQCRIGWHPGVPPGRSWSFEAEDRTLDRAERSLTAYTVSKGAVIALTKAIAADHGVDGIRANCVAPGLVYTPMVYSRRMTEQARETPRRASVLNREGTGWDIGGAVRFLLSDQARYITGQVLVVDGGATLVGPSRASQ
jgi:NAD(P)-dependent dehydrogenase (short-subunit alcohol dehydrogenase family)